MAASYIFLSESFNLLLKFWNLNESQAKPFLLKLLKLAFLTRTSLKIFNLVLCIKIYYSSQRGILMTCNCYLPLTSSSCKQLHHYCRFGQIKYRPFSCLSLMYRKAGADLRKKIQYLQHRFLHEIMLQTYCEYLMTLFRWRLCAK